MLMHQPNTWSFGQGICVMTRWGLAWNTVDWSWVRRLDTRFVGLWTFSFDTIQTHMPKHSQIKSGACNIMEHMELCKNCRALKFTQFLLFNHKRQDKSQVLLSQLVEGLLQETSIIINSSWGFSFEITSLFPSLKRNPKRWTSNSGEFLTSVCWARGLANKEEPAMFSEW